MRENWFARLVVVDFRFLSVLTRSLVRQTPDREMVMFFMMMGELIPASNPLGTVGRCAFRNPNSFNLSHFHLDARCFLLHGEDCPNGEHILSKRSYFVETRTTDRNEVVVSRLSAEVDGFESLTVIGLDGVARRVNVYRCDEAFAKRVRCDEARMSPGEKSRTYVGYGGGPIREVGDAHFRRPAGRAFARRAVAIKARKTRTS